MHELIFLFYKAKYIFVKDIKTERYLLFVSDRETFFVLFKTGTGDT